MLEGKKIKLLAESRNIFAKTNVLEIVWNNFNEFEKEKNSQTILGNDNHILGNCL